MIAKKFGIGILFLAMFLVGMAFVPAVNAETEKNSNEVSIENSITYTDAELQDLYIKHNISENDIKFAKGELPNLLNETILNGDTKVIVTEDGKPLENMKKGIDYDMIISESEMLSIVKQAEKDYFDKYGVDPSNPKIDIVDGKAIPTEEIKVLVENGDIELSDSSISSTVTDCLVRSVSWNPKEVNDRIYVHVYPAIDSFHEPSQNYYQDTIDGINRFENFGINVYDVWHYGSWDASDGVPADNASSILDDLVGDCSYIRDSDNDIVLGWVDFLDHNGMAYRNGPYSLCAVKASGVDWPHDSIVQHEISHNFGALDQNSALHPTCIMNYAHAYGGANIWCISCGNTVNNGIYN